MHYYQHDGPNRLGLLSNQAAAGLQAKRPSGLPLGAGSLPRSGAGQQMRSGFDFLSPSFDPTNYPDKRRPWVEAPRAVLVPGMCNRCAHPETQICMPAQAKHLL